MPTPFTTDMMDIIRRLHAEFAASARNGSFSVEFHYHQGIPRVGKILWPRPEQCFTLCSSSV